MANPIIQNYLSDPSIPEEKKQFAISQINDGVPEEKIAGGITQKYGDIYLPQTRQSEGGEMSVEEFMQKQAENTSFRDRPIRGSRQSFQKATPQVNLKTRVRDALKGAYDAGKSGLDTLAGGVQNMRGSANMMNQSQEWAKQAQAEFEKDGDKAKFEKKMAVIQGLGNKANETRKLGQSQAFLGGIKTATSPITGTIGGALKPELQKIGEGAGNAFEGMSEKNKKRVLDAISAIKKVTEEHPALTNYASGLFELGTIGVGGKAAKKTADMAIDATKATASMAGGLANAGLDATIGAGKFAKKGVDKLKAIKPINLPSSQSKNLKIATELLTPEVNKKNLRIAASQGLATEGKKSLFSGTKDMIALDKRMERARDTLVNKFTDLNKTSSFTLPTKISSEIKKIAEPLRSTFKQIEVPDNVKGSLLNSWKKLKKSQQEGLNFDLGVDKVQKQFESVFSKLISKKYRGPDGKYRPQSIDDLWEAVKAFDKKVGDPIKDAVEVAASDRNLAMQEAWLESRKLLREAMDSMVKTMDDINSKKAFQEMADLYEAQSQILKNIKPTNKTGESIAGSAAKEYLKNALPYGGAAVAGGLIAN